MNGYPYLCRPAPSEGSQAECNPFLPESPCAYIPIGLFMRFDMAPEDAAHCGEYRIVFAKQSGLLDRNDRATAIFEAVMPNPHPQQGLKGCDKIVKLWASLSGEEDPLVRRDTLEGFYFDGHGNIPPVIQVAHFGDNESAWGQIRTNQFVHTETGWSLREFQLRRSCDESSCTNLEVVPVTTKTNPFGYLFEPESQHEQAISFRSYLPTQTEALAGAALGQISMNVPDVFNSAQSQSSSSSADEMRYLDRLGPDPSALRSAMEDELYELNAALSVDDIVLRAQAMTCAGCHRLSRRVELGGGLVWPADLGFVHVSERVIETVDGEHRYGISEALTDEFLPARQQILQDYLDNKPRPPQAQNPDLPIAGHTHHG
jgi:hypothetical protein